MPDNPYGKTRDGKTKVKMKNRRTKKRAAMVEKNHRPPCRRCDTLLGRWCRGKSGAEEEEGKTGASGKKSAGKKKKSGLRKEGTKAFIGVGA